MELVDVTEGQVAHKAAVIFVEMSLNRDRLVEVVAKVAKTLFISLKGLLCDIPCHFGP